jgi:hypothetical protein
MTWVNDVPASYIIFWFENNLWDKFGFATWQRSNGFFGIWKIID